MVWFMSEKIKFTDVETKEEIEFNVIEETRINNVNYLLVTESMETEDKTANRDMNESEEETAYILKDLSSQEDKQANYIIVDDDNELEAVSKVFEELLENIDIE